MRPLSPIARKGFRPFFFLAGLFAIAIVPAWLLVLFGVMGDPRPHLDITTWHAHEMIFGYALAVIAGFLLTAVANWTGRETLVGGWLLGLAAVWLLGRIAMIAPPFLGRGVTAAIDLSFLPLLIVALARPLVAARNWRNMVMLGVLSALFAANVVVHLDALGMVGASGTGRAAMRTAVDIVIALCVIITGRVVPMFTRNGIRATPATTSPSTTTNETIRGSPALEKLAGGAMLLVLLVDVREVLSGRPSSALSAGVAALAGIATVVRSARWGTRYTLPHPLLWILHVGSAWIAVGFLLRAGLALVEAPSGAMSSSLATHALTLGAIGALTLGMMARVALGHTGRPLTVGRSMAIAFVSITLAAAARVAVPLIWPSSLPTSLVLAGVLWTLAFAIFLAAVAPILFRPRVDLKPG